MKQTRYVYFARDRDGRTDIKIGITTNITQRMKQVKSDLILAVPCEHEFARRLERALHEEFGRHRFQSCEWFRDHQRLDGLIHNVLKLGYWPWDRRSIIRGQVR